MWIILLLIGLIHTVICSISFNKNIHDRWWYFPLGLCLGISSNALWLFSAKLLGEKNEIYIFSLLWDCVMVGVYFLVPVFVFGIKLDRIGIIGLILVLVGTLLIKIRLS
jgi:drug/metabolite transporter (DMT)-like permease